MTDKQEALKPCDCGGTARWEPFTGSTLLICTNSGAFGGACERPACLDAETWNALSRPAPPIPDDVVEAAVKMVDDDEPYGLGPEDEKMVRRGIEAVLTASGLLDKNKALEAENAALRAERDALLQKPLDLAKMDSVDDDTDTSAKMIAYYWHDQAQEARDKNKALEGLLPDLRLLLAHKIGALNIDVRTARKNLAEKLQALKDMEA